MTTHHAGPGIHAGRGNIRNPYPLTWIESRTHFAAWCIVSSPLVLVRSYSYSPGCRPLPCSSPLPFTTSRRLWVRLTVLCGVWYISPSALRMMARSHAQGLDLANGAHSQWCTAQYNTLVLSRAAVLLQLMLPFTRALRPTLTSSCTWMFCRCSNRDQHGPILADPHKSGSHRRE